MKHRPLSFAAVAVAVAAMSGCYGAKLVRGPINSEHASIQTDSLRAQHVRVLRELAALRRQNQEQLEANVRYRAQMSTSLSELEETLRILTSRFDDSAQRSSYGGSASTPPPAQQRRMTQAAMDTSMTLDDSSAVSGPGGSEDDLYRAAYLDVTRGNYDLAEVGFQNYLMRFPAGRFLPEVHYYLGECHYASERFLEAVPEYRLVVSTFPTSRLAPSAYLKYGRCYEALEERRLAAEAFRTLIEKHPNTEEAAQARAALSALEG